MKIRASAITNEQKTMEVRMVKDKINASRAAGLGDLHYWRYAGCMISDEAYQKFLANPGVSVSWRFKLPVSEANLSDPLCSL